MSNLIRYTKYFATDKDYLKTLDSILDSDSTNKKIQDNARLIGHLGNLGSNIAGKLGGRAMITNDMRKIGKGLSKGNNRLSYDLAVQSKNKYGAVTFKPEIERISPTKARVGGLSYSPGEDLVNIGAAKINLPEIGIDQSVLAHELGHREQWKGAHGNLVGNLDQISRRTRKVLPVANLITPTIAAKSTINELKGKKKAKYARYIMPTLTGLLNAPVMGMEIGASVRGVKNLKKLGATSEEIKDARKNLARAGLSYGLSTTGQVAGSMLSSYLTKKSILIQLYQKMKAKHPEMTKEDFNKVIKLAKNRNNE